MSSSQAGSTSDQGLSHQRSTALSKAGIRVLLVSEKFVFSRQISLVGASGHLYLLSVYIYF